MPQLDLSKLTVEQFCAQVGIDTQTLLLATLQHVRATPAPAQATTKGGRRPPPRVPASAPVEPGDAPAHAEDPAPRKKRSPFPVDLYVEEIKKRGGDLDFGETIEVKEICLAVDRPKDASQNLKNNLEKVNAGLEELGWAVAWVSGTVGKGGKPSVLRIDEI